MTGRCPAASARASWPLLAGLLLLLAGGAAAEAPVAAGPPPGAAARVDARPEPGPLDLWPLVVRDARPVAGLRSTRLAGPFFESWQREREDGALERGWTLRPALARLEGPEGLDLEFLHPLGELRWREERRRFRLTPLADFHERYPAAEEAGFHQWVLGPAFGGRSREGERSLGVFPFGGSARQRFGKQRIDFALFPLFGRSRDDEGFVRTHLLWPFISFGSGGGRSLLRIWPFYGHDRREGEWERRFVLWPFFYWGREKPGSESERSTRLLLPFYAETRSAHSRAFAIGGPLYGRSENRRSGARSTHVLWPFYRRASRPLDEAGAQATDLQLQPLLRIQNTAEGRRTRLLLGAVDRFEGETRSSLRLLFAGRFERREDAARGETWLRRELWPFFRFREQRAGGEARGELDLPWLLPVGDRAFLRHLGGLGALYQRRWQDGESRSDWLFGLARRRQTPDYALDAVSWLYRRERLAGEAERLDLLGIPLRRRPR